MLGGKRMDMFMDKLAQKLTAQEIIKANTAADAEELNHLRKQVADYDDCLAKLQKLIDEENARLAETRKESGNAVNGLAEELKHLGKQVADQQDVLAKVQQTLTGQQDEALTRLQQSVADQQDTLAELQQTLTGQQDEALTKLQQSVTEQLAAVEKAVSDKLEKQTDGQLEERLNLVEENVHKECVKVYRNVQAVVVEESGKQKEAAEAVTAGVEAVKGKLGVVMGVSAAALVFSLVTMILQILEAFQIRFF